MFLQRASYRRRLVIGSIVAMLCGFIAAQGASADDPLKKKQNQVQQQLKNSTADLEDSSAALTAATSALHSAQAQLDSANAALASTRKALAEAVVADKAMLQRLVSSQAQLQSAQDAVVTAKGMVAEQRLRVARFASQTLFESDPELLKVLTLLQQGTADEIAGHLGVIQSVSDAQAARYREYTKQVEDLTTKEAAVSRATGEVAKQREMTAAAVETRAKYQAQAEEQSARVQKLVAQRSAAEEHAASLRKRDLATLAALKAQDAAIRQQILARARTQTSRPSNTSRGGGGMLLRPVTGPITSPYGWRRHPIYGYWGLHDGADFAAACGEGQVAADSGTVISETYSDVWGKRLYIDLGKINGHNYTVIHNHLSGYAVSVGQRVSRGQVVGYTGTTGWSTGCHLHYTVLRDGTAVNPEPYI